MIDEKKLIRDLFYKMPCKFGAKVMDWFHDLIDSQPKIGEWIPCSERLPEEKINPITQDYYIYPVTFLCEGVTDIRYYSFGNGHWRFGQMIMDDYVIAWQLLPEPYKPESEGQSE